MQINSISPQAGDPLYPVRIIGVGFYSGGPVSVIFNGVPASPVSVLNDTEIDCCVPQTATSGLVVITDAQNNNASINFTVTNVPPTFEAIDGDGSTSV